MSAPRKSKPSAIVHQPAAQLYERFVADIKQRIRTAQIKAALAANAQLILHYWEIGCDILANQKQEGWGAKVIDRLASDLQHEFPTLSGYAARNLKYMRAFAEAWPDRAIVQQLVAQLPWGHNCVLLDRVKDPATRQFYIRKTIEHGWSRSVLTHQLDTQLHKRAGKALTNFAFTLPMARPSASSSAGAKTRRSWNTRCAMPANPWPWPNTACCRPSSRPSCPMPTDSNKSSFKWNCRMKNNNLNCQARGLEQTIVRNVAETSKA